MFPVYNKPFLTLPQQIALLKQRGLQFRDESSAAECLHRNGYYRLSAYWYPLREIVPVLNGIGNPLLDSRGKPRRMRSDNFLPGSTFEHAQELYVFDKKLKLLLLDAIERVEIAARAEIARCLGGRDRYAHTNPIFFRHRFLRPDMRDRTQRSQHRQWLDKFDEAVRRSKDDFVLHHEAKYGSREPLPIWIAIELWDLAIVVFLQWPGDPIPRCHNEAIFTSSPRSAGKLVTKTQLRP